MALAATTVWEARTTGLSTNGGGFDPVLGASATDYSVQDSPQLALVDIAIANNTTTTITSATGGFTSAMIGNVIYLTGGSGGVLTTQRRQITAVTDTNTATVDQAPAPSSAMTGVTGNLGGALSAPWDVYSSTAGSNDFVIGNTLYIKRGTYTRTSAWIGKDTGGVASTDLPVHIVGYDVSRSIFNTDENRPIITISTNSITLFVGMNMVGMYFVKNLIFSNTASVKGVGIANQTTRSSAWWINCKFTGFSTAMAGGGSSSSRVDALLVNCEITQCNIGIDSGGNSSAWYFIGCYIHDNTSHGIFINARIGTFITNCLIVNNGGNGFVSAPSTGVVVFRFYDNTVANNNSSQIRLEVTSNPYTNAGTFQLFFNNIMYGGNYGISIAGTGSYPTDVFTSSRKLSSQIFGGSVVSNRLNVNAVDSDMDLNGNPFLYGISGSSGRDYRLNSYENLGRSCQQNGYPKYCGNVLSGLLTSYCDFGACPSLPPTIIL